MDSENTCVDDALQIDVQDFGCGLFRLSALICFQGQVVGAWTNARIDEDVVDSAILLLRFLEQRNQVGPLCYICWHIQEVAGDGWWLDVTADN